jgi:hypothetical protein
MPNQVPPSPLGGNPYKITVFTNYAQWGWSDTFYYSSPNPLGSPDILLAAQVLMQVLQLKNGLDCNVAGARVTTLDQSNPLLTSLQQARIVTAQQAQIPPPAVVFSPLSAWDGGLLTIPDLSYYFKRPWIVRGLTSTWFANPAASGFLPIAAVPFQTWINTFNQKVLGVGTIVNGVPTIVKPAFQGQFALKAIIKGGGLAAPFPKITSAVLDTNGKITVGFVPPTSWPNTALPGVPYQGQWIVIRGMRLKCGKAFNGRAQITNLIAPTPPSTVYVVTISRPWCCAGMPLVVKTYGTIVPLTYGLYALGGASFERYVKRDTGRSFFGTRGRQSASCC